MRQNDCMQELCWNWDGDGRHCICERLAVEPDTEDRWPHGCSVNSSSSRLIIAAINGGIAKVSTCASSCLITRGTGISANAGRCPTAGIGAGHNNDYRQGKVMSSGKRTNVNDPLTEHDAAERIGTAAMRLNSILTSLGGLGIEREIRRSRYWPTGLLESLRDELTRWINAVSPAPVHDAPTARAVLNRVREELLPYDYDTELNKIAAEFGVEPYDWEAALSE